MAKTKRIYEYIIKIMEQLKEGLWYRSTQSRTNSIYFLEKISSNSSNPHFSYGINGFGNWSESMERYFPKFQPAEDWVVSDALKKEARERYKGKKIRCLTFGSVKKFTGIHIDFHYHRLVFYFYLNQKNQYYKKHWLVKEQKRQLGLFFLPDC